MVLVNVNSKDAIDVQNIFLILSNYDPGPAKNDNRYISLSRTEKTRSYLITRDNYVYGLSLKPDAFLNKYYKAYKEFGAEPNVAFKLNSTDYYVGVSGILLITDTLSRVMEAENKRLEKLNRTFNLSTRKTKTFLFVKGETDSFVVKTNLTKATVFEHIKSAVKRHGG